MPFHITCEMLYIIWNGCICKDYTEFWICLSMAQYATTMLEYASVCLNAPQYAWTSLNNNLNMTEFCWMPRIMSENVWINSFDYARFSICLIILDILQGSEVLNMPEVLICQGSNMLQYSYNIIIILTNIIILELVPARFTPPGSWQLFFSIS